jgi:hypothetical protein
MRHVRGEDICLQGSGGKHDGKKPLERPRHRWENNIKLDLKEFDWEVVDWIDVVHDKDKQPAVVSMVMNKLVLMGVPT